MRYGFVKNGGFAVVDDEKRVGAYAYPSSTSAERAKKSPEKVAAEMLERASWPGMPQDLREEHYHNAFESLKG